MSEPYETILTETRGRVLLITLNRPKALNALNAQLTREVIRAATEADADPGIGCIVVTGSARAFTSATEGATRPSISAASAKEKVIERPT